MTNDKKVEPEVKFELSQVAMSKKQGLLIVALTAFGVIFVGYFFYKSNFHQETEEKKVVMVNEKDIKMPPKEGAFNKTAESIEAPKLLEPKAPEAIPKPPVTLVEVKPNIIEEKKVEPVKAIEVVPMPAVTPPVAQVPLVQPKALDKANEKAEQKRKSSIIMFGGASAPEKKATITPITNISKGLFIRKGKVIDAVLETALNSNFQGEVRAIVSRDVYSDNGKVVLISKGSRVFGTFGIGGGYDRLNITWNRIDLASGYSLSFTGNATDNLGRSGVESRVDPQYAEQLSNAVLTTVFNVGVANLMDKIVTPPRSSSKSTEKKNKAIAIRTQAQTYYNSNDPNRWQSICTMLQTSITDATDPNYITINTECNNLRMALTGTPNDKATTAYNLANTVADSLLTDSVSAASPTQAQTAAAQGVKNITDVVKQMITQNNFSKVLSLDQGKQVKIYVNQDYEFPPEVIGVK